MSTAGEFIHVSLWIKQDIYDKILRKIENTDIDGLEDYLIKLLEKEVSLTHAP